MKNKADVKEKQIFELKNIINEVSSLDGINSRMVIVMGKISEL